MANYVMCVLTGILKMCALEEEVFKLAPPHNREL